MLSTEFSRYGYDSASRITQVGQTLHSSAGAVSMNWTVAYDSRDRITQFSRAGASSAYRYDANSNRLGSVSTTVGDTNADGAFDQGDWNQSSVQSLNVDPTSNRLLGLELVQTTTSTNAKGKVKTTSTSSAWSYVLDAVGNLLGDGVRQFDYDANNRLSQVSIGQGQEASKVTYLHNALGLRVFKSEPQVAQLAPDEETLGAGFVAWLKRFFGWLFGAAQENATLGQSYVYDDAVLGETPSLLGEYGNGGSRSSGRLEYLWLPTESGQAIPVGLYRHGRFYAVHSDHLGTPRLITDDAATPVWQWAYSAFGENSPSGILKATTNPKQALTNQPMLLKASKPAITVNLRFPGQYADEESGLFYNHFRSYRPGVGSYTQADPIGLEGGWNRMGYVEGNPLSFYDDDGLDKKDPKPIPQQIAPMPSGGGKSFNPSGAFKPIPFPGAVLGGFRAPNALYPPNAAVVDRMNNLRISSGTDCSEIASVLRTTAGEGKILRVTGQGSSDLRLFENGKMDGPFKYHEVFTDGKYVYDPRLNSSAVPLGDWTRMIRQLNPGAVIK